MARQTLCNKCDIFSDLNGLLILMTHRSRFSVPLLLLLLGLFMCLLSQAQDPVYRWSWKVDAPLLIAGAGVSGSALVLHAQLEPATEQEVHALNANDVWRIDRSATRNYSSSIGRASDYVLAGSAALPL